MQASSEQDRLWIEREVAYINVKFRLLQLKLAVELERRAFNPNQPRDEIGRWADGGGSTDRKPIVGVQVAQSGPRLPWMTVRPQNTSIDIGEVCFDRCQHLMKVGHGNEYRACYLKCWREYR